MAGMLSQITTCLGPKAVQSVLDGVTLGAAQRVEGMTLPWLRVTITLRSKYVLLLGKF